MNFYHMTGHVGASPRRDTGGLAIKHRQRAVVNRCGGRVDRLGELCMLIIQSADLLEWWMKVKMSFEVWVGGRRNGGESVDFSKSKLKGLDRLDTQKITSCEWGGTAHPKLPKQTQWT